MKTGMYKAVGMSILVMMFICGCVVNENYKKAEDLGKLDRWEEAIPFYEAAIKDDPASQEHKDGLLRAKQQIAQTRYVKANITLDAAPAQSVPVLEQAVKLSASALSFDPDNKTIKSFHDQLKQKIDTTIAQVKSLYSQAEADMAKEDWTAASVKMKEVNKLYPNYEETAKRLSRIEEERIKMLYQQGIELGKQEEWKAAIEVFKAVMDINPKYYDIEMLYENAKSNDNATHYMSVADTAQKEKQWEKAIIYLEKAKAYQPDNQEISKMLENLKQQVWEIFFTEAGALSERGKLYQAVRRIELMKSYMPSRQEFPAFLELIKITSGKLMARSERLVEDELWGGAWIWLSKLESLNPSYPELSQKKQDVEDRIKKRIKKTMAVFTFSSPGNEKDAVSKDAGSIVANKLIAYLQKNAGGDVSIIDRDNLQSIIKEMNLEQAGAINLKNARAIGKAKGIDTFIMGEVLNYSAIKTDTSSMSQAKVLVSEEDVSNPAFAEWLVTHKDPTEEQMKSAPPRTIKKGNYQFVSYKQGMARITALLEASYRLVDAVTGEIILKNTISGKSVKEDKYQDAVPAANIPLDLEELPAEGEILDELTAGKISEAGQSVLKHFQDLEKVYFNEGQKLQDRRNMDRAVEKYVDTMFAEKMKSLSSPLTTNARETIDKLIQDK